MCASPEGGGCKLSVKLTLRLRTMNERPPVSLQHMCGMLSGAHPNVPWMVQFHLYSRVSFFFHVLEK